MKTSEQNLKEINLYPTSQQLFSELVNERKKRKDNVTFDFLALEHLKKSWFAIVEATGGGAMPIANSKRFEERAMFHIEQALIAFGVEPIEKIN